MPASPHQHATGREAGAGAPTDLDWRLANYAVMARATSLPNQRITNLALPDERGSVISATGGGAVPSFTVDGDFIKPGAGSLYLYRNIGTKARIVRAQWRGWGTGAGANVVMLGCSSNAVFAAANNQVHPVWYRDAYSMTIYEAGVARTLIGYTAYPNGYTIPQGEVVTGALILDGTTAIMELPGGGHAAVTDAAIATYTGPTVVWQAFTNEVEFYSVSAQY